MSGHTKVEDLEKALAHLVEAMTFRWREIVTYAIVEGGDYPKHFERQPTSFDQSMWPYWEEPNIFHLGWEGVNCAYVQWVESGQKDDVSSVTCDGSTHATLAQREEGVPDNVHCGMGRILEQIEGWARAECAIVYDRLPKFEGSNMGAIRDAHDEFIRIGGNLALTAGPKSGDVSFEGVSGLDLVNTVEDLSGEDNERRKWWAGWTGLAASLAKDSFFASCKPTIQNQSGILAALANLYSLRAAVMEETRCNSLAWIQWAAKGLHETQVNIQDITPVWKTVQGVGTFVSISGGWSGVGGAVGVSINLLGFLGENLLSEVKGGREYKHDLGEVVEKLLKEADVLNSRVADMESDYGDAVTELQTTLFGIHSFDLELYDLTENSSDGNRKSDDGFTADIVSILNIGEACFDAGEDYEALLPKIDLTTDADKYLADKDGNPTWADTELLEIRDQLKGFLKTTAGRYLLAGEQVKEAAELYASGDADQKAGFDQIMLEQGDGFLEHDSDINPKKEAKDTDRGNFDPHEYSGRPVNKPGEDAEHDYITDETDPNPG